MPCACGLDGGVGARAGGWLAPAAPFVPGQAQRRQRRGDIVAPSSRPFVPIMKPGIGRAISRPALLAPNRPAVRTRHSGRTMPATGPAMGRPWTAQARQPPGTAPVSRLRCSAPGMARAQDDRSCNACHGDVHRHCAGRWRALMCRAGHNRPRSSPGSGPSSQPHAEAWQHP